MWNISLAFKYVNVRKKYIIHSFIVSLWQLNKIIINSWGVFEVSKHDCENLQPDNSNLYHPVSSFLSWTSLTSSISDLSWSFVGCNPTRGQSWLEFPLESKKSPSDVTGLNISVRLACVLVAGSVWTCLRVLYVGGDGKLMLSNGLLTLVTLHLASLSTCVLLWWATR